VTNWVAALATACVLTAFTARPIDALPEVLSLKLYNIHTQAQGTFVFKRNGVYDQQGLAQLNSFLRDWRMDQPTHMDPHLFDILYQVYKQSGSSDYIHVVCGYRTPDTNAMLRRRSKLVAQKSLHMQGRAMDFFIPDVPLAKLRVIGMRLQSGGVGFYPTSGSPFVHMDTGDVRHWPRMTRQELIAAFPDGRTLDVPTDGKPLPGYAEALADYQARKAKGGAIADYAVASNAKPVVFTNAQVAAADARADRTGGDDGPIQLASADEGDDNIPDAPAKPAAVTPAKAAASAPAAPKAVAVAAVPTATLSAPLPHLAPKNNPPQTLVATAETPTPQLQAQPVALTAPAPSATAPAAPALAANGQSPLRPLVLATATAPLATAPAGRRIDFGSQEWSEPAVPTELAQAMAARDQIRRGASLPISPTSVVATIDVSRPLRAEAITTAVLRTTTEAAMLNPGVLAYADPGLTTSGTNAAQPAPITIHRASMTSIGVPLPQLRPFGAQAAAAPAPLRVVRPHMEAPPLLTMTSLDTQGLRLWMGSQSTRQKAYALLTMPDFVQSPGLMHAPTVTFGAGFGPTAYRDLRTDRFSGPLVEQPSMIDVSGTAEVASIQ
jgi:uncharacterized protein YcbK (DUF882 family)